MTKSNLKVVKSTKDQEMDVKEKNKALDAAIAQITDNFGKGSVMKLGQKRAMDIESVSTGSLSLDLALGIGGLPKGRIIEVYGPESSGKTTLALQVVAEAQKAGGICAFVDAEHALDPVYAKKLGVNTEELLISQPDAGEQALEIADDLDAHQQMLLCCLKYMSQDDVEDMLKINDYITPPELDEEDDSWYTDPMSKASYHHY